jgi:hypothetical protein
MFTAFRRHRHWCEDMAAAALAIGYFGGFMVGIEFALARLLYMSAFR